MSWPTTPIPQFDSAALSCVANEQLSSKGVPVCNKLKLAVVEAAEVVPGPKVAPQPFDALFGQVE